MNQRILDEEIEFQPTLGNVGMDGQPKTEGGEAGAGLREEGESEVIRRDPGSKHLGIERNGEVRVLGFGEASDEGVIDEGGWGGEGSEDPAGVVDVSGVGYGREEEEFGDEEVVGGEAMVGDLGVDSLQLAHRLAPLEEEDEGVVEMG